MSWPWGADWLNDRNHAALFLLQSCRQRQHQQVPDRYFYRVPLTIPDCAIFLLFTSLDGGLHIRIGLRRLQSQLCLDLLVLNPSQPSRCEVFSLKENTTIAADVSLGDDCIRWEMPSLPTTLLIEIAMIMDGHISVGFEYRSAYFDSPPALIRYHMIRNHSFFAY